MRVNLFRAFLSVFLLTTLCLAVGCLPQPKPESLGYITVLTYNTHLFEGSREEFGGLRRKEILDDKQRAEKMLYKIADSHADIVALQEVWAAKNQEWFCQSMKPLYPYCAVSGQKEDLKDFFTTGYLNTCGLVLLSKYKFTEKAGFYEFNRNAFKWWKLEDLSERLARKGVITATVELEPGGPTIRLGISQTATGHGMEMVDSERSAAETARSETGRSVIDSPAIMMGDFNVHARYQVEFDRLKEKFAKYDAVDAYREVHPCDSEERMTEDDYTIDREKNLLHQEFFKPNKDPRIDRDRIDYVFVKKSGSGLELKPVEAEVIRDWKYQHTTEKVYDLSDHYPVKVKFKVTRTTTR